MAKSYYHRTSNRINKQTFSCCILQNGIYREYSPSNRQVYSSTITVSKTIYDPDAVQQQQQQMLSASRASPRLQASPSPRTTLDRRQTNSPSVVGGNLSELDTLLDDLNTSTKMYSTSTMERRAAGCSSRHQSLLPLLFIHL